MHGREGSKRGSDQAKAKGLEIEEQPAVELLSRQLIEQYQTLRYNCFTYCDYCVYAVF